MGTRNDDISLKLAKAVKQGFLPDVSDSEVGILEVEAKRLFTEDKTYTRGIDVNTTALSLPGSNKTGNVRVGSQTTTIADTGHNAFPGLAKLSDGNLISVWRSAPQHDPAPTAGVIKARKLSADGVMQGDAYTILTDTLDLRDPMLTRLSDGRIVMQYFKHDGTANTIKGVWLAISKDDGATFTVIGKVPYTWDTLIASAGRMVVAPNGTWIVAAYGRNSNTFNNIRTMISSDEGKTWTNEVTVAEGQAESRNYVEPVLGILPDGSTLMCLIRVSDSNGANPAIYRTTSTDNGLTWAAETSVLAGNGGRPAWITLTSGAVVLVSRYTTAPYPMQVHTSWDSGLTWGTSTQIGLSPSSQGAYAQPVEIANGLVGVVFSIENNAASAANLYFGYLGDGIGFSPIGDDFTDAEGILFKGAAEGGLVGGAPTLTQVQGFPIWQLSASAVDQVAFTFRVPKAWKSLNVAVLWVNTAGGTVADVLFRADMNQVNVLGSLTSTAGANILATVGDQFILVETQTNSNVSKSGEFLRVKPTRLGSDAADTYANTIGIIGVRLTRVS